MSFSARFTSQPAAGARRAALAQIGPLVDHDLARQVRRNPDAPVEQPLADLDTALGEPAVLQDPDHARSSVISLDESEGHKQAFGNRLLDDFDFGLFAKIPQLVLRVADAAAHVDTPFFGDAVVLLVDADNFRLDRAVRFGPQTYEGPLAERQTAGQCFVDVGLDPDRVRRDQREYILAGVGDAAQLLQAADHPCVERRAQFVLRQDARVDLALRAGVVLLTGRDPGIRLDDLGIAESDFFRRLRVLGGFLRNAPAAGERLAPHIDVLLLLVGDFGTRALGLGLGKVRRRLVLRRFAFLQLGAL